MPLRELQAEIDWKRKAILLPIAVVVLAKLGPFGTYSDLHFTQRLAYWGTAILGISVPMNLAILQVLRSPALAKLRVWQRLLIGTGIGSVPGTIMVVGIERVFRPTYTGMPALFDLFIAVWMIAVIVAMVDFRAYLVRDAEDRQTRPAEPAFPDEQALQVPASAAEAADNPAPMLETVPFLRRLPPEIGQDVVSLTMQDHYVQVRTTKGNCVLLLRMSDAVDELRDYGGGRIHRSHWVAYSQIERLDRRGSGYVATMTTGEQLPVSRTYQGRLKAIIAGRSSETAS